MTERRKSEARKEIEMHTHQKKGERAQRLGA